MRTFRVRFVNGTTCELKADFLTAKILNTLGSVCFWIRGEHWWERPHCVGIFDWTTIYGVSPAETSDEIAHQLGVQL